MFSAGLEPAKARVGAQPPLHSARTRGTWRDSNPQCFRHGLEHRSRSSSGSDAEGCRGDSNPVHRDEKPVAHLLRSAALPKRMLS